MRRMNAWSGGAAIAALALAACQPADDTTIGTDTGFSIPVEYYKLDNGLRVILSPDHTAPTVVSAVSPGWAARSYPMRRSRHLPGPFAWRASRGMPRLRP